jgi:hypothetical protein
VPRTRFPMRIRRKRPSKPKIIEKPLESLIVDRSYPPIDPHLDRVALISRHSTITWLRFSSGRLGTKRRRCVWLHSCGEKPGVGASDRYRTRTDRCPDEDQRHQLRCPGRVCGVKRSYDVPPPEGHGRVAISRLGSMPRVQLERGSRPRARQRQMKVAHSDRALFERAPNAHAQGALDVISKNVVPDTEVVASPADD